MALSGCLTTTKPVLNDTNSIAAGKSALFVAFVEAWDAKIPGADGSPRELIEQGVRVKEIGSHVLIQEAKDDGGADYYTVALFDGRPMMCMAHNEGIETIAARHGVTVTIEESDDAGPGAPSPMTADGTEAALFGFVMDVFGHGNIVCQMPGVKSE